MSSLFELAKILGIDTGPLNQAELQKQVCIMAMERISKLTAKAEHLRGAALCGITTESAQAIETLKAQWQAEALNDMAEEFMHHERARSVLKRKAAELRQVVQQTRDV